MDLNITILNETANRNNGNHNQPIHKTPKEEESCVNKELMQTEVDMEALNRQCNKIHPEKNQNIYADSNTKKYSVEKMFAHVDVVMKNIINGSESNHQNGNNLLCLFAIVIILIVFGIVIYAVCIKKSI